MRLRFRMILLTLATAAGGCGPGQARHALPQIQDQGGPVLSHASLISVTFEGDPMAASLDEFIQRLPESSVWQAGAEYGIGAARATSAVHTTFALSVGPPVDDLFWQNNLPSLVGMAGNAGLGPEVADAVYVLFLPPGVQATASGQTGCQQFGGYHSAVRLSDGTPLAYAVIPRCPGGINNLSEADSVTAEASHEILESVTDPYFNLQQGAWSSTGDEDLAFTVALGGGEMGDLCIYSEPTYYVPADLPYMVQRLYSNQAAAAGNDPCLPAAPGPFFQSIPNITTQLPFNLTGTTFNARALAIPVGQQATVSVELYGPNDPTVPWSVSVVTLDDSAVTGTFAPDAGGLPGQALSLTLTVVTPGTMLGKNVEAVGLVSQEGDPLDGGRAQLWPILISSD